VVAGPPRSAADVLGLWAQAVPVPVIAQGFAHVLSQQGLRSGPGKSFGDTLLLLGICFGSGGVICVSLLIVLINE